MFHSIVLIRDKIFHPTMQSTKDEIKRRIGLPCNVFKSMVVEAPAESKRHRHGAPRNIKQVQNFQANRRQKFRLDRDSFFNLHYSATTSKFVKFIQTYPDFICIMHLDPLVAKIMGLIDRPDLGSFGLQYDTTFNLGDVYVSVLIMRYLEFEQEPLQPFVLMMHDKKTKKVHHTFFRKVAEWFPSSVSNHKFEFLAHLI